MLRLGWRTRVRAVACAVISFAAGVVALTAGASPIARIVAAAIAIPGVYWFVDLLVATSAYGINRTFGGMCYNGSGHMQDEYGSSGYNEFIHWTIFGDPSLRVRSDTPFELDVAHIPVIYPSMTTFDVTVSSLSRDPIEEAMCALYGGGVLYGVALTDASGNASIPVGTMPTPGEVLVLTVTAFNAMTYTADIPVVVPVTYSIDPPTIPVNTFSAVTVTARRRSTRWMTA